MPSLEKALVVKHFKWGMGLYEMEVIAPSIANECSAGQFVHILVNNEETPLLRRPFSIYDVDAQLGSVTILYKVVGSGTQILTGVLPKGHIDIMGPLGRGFDLPQPKKNVVLVGGGVGIAPLIYLARVLLENKCNVRVLYGTETRQQLVSFDKLRQLGATLLAATVDGSAGFKGLVTDLLNKKIDPSTVDYIYTCGPETMMAKVTEYAQKYDIPGEVSLEEHMACGVGACLGCARKLKKTDEIYVKICKDGPVFSMHQISFE